MSELRNDTFMALGPSNYTAYLNIQKVIQELQAPHVPGRFILKPKEISRDVQQSSESLPYMFSYSQAFQYLWSILLKKIKWYPTDKTISN